MAGPLNQSDKNCFLSGSGGAAQKDLELCPQHRHLSAGPRIPERPRSRAFVCVKG